MKPLNLRDLEQQAKETLPQIAYEYFASGAWDEVTLRENRAAFERIQVHYRVLVDVSQRSLARRILGQQISMPILIAPTAFHCLAHADGELATVRAAGAAGTIMVLSGLSSCPVDEVAAAASSPLLRPGTGVRRNPTIVRMLDGVVSDLVRNDVRAHIILLARKQQSGGA